MTLYKEETINSAFNFIIGMLLQYCRVFIRMNISPPCQLLQYILKLIIFVKKMSALPVSCFYWLLRMQFLAVDSWSTECNIEINGRLYLSVCSHLFTCGSWILLPGLGVL